MDIKWRTVQFFISLNGVCEVQADDSEKKKLRCTCIDFNLLAKCKHTKFVREKIGETGSYTIKLAEDAEEETIVAAMEDPDMFRDFLLHYSKIESIE